jgi:orotidine-5'-phosphate decarboxylase
MFVVLKTSNEGSRDYQDQVLQATGRPLYENVAATANELGKPLIGDSGYSSVGAVVGATFPDDARRLRSLMPQAFILVTGYGVQGASGRNAAVSFNADGLGAIVSSSRAITYAYADQDLNSEAFAKCVRENTLRMIDNITKAATAAARAG